MTPVDVNREGRVALLTLKDPATNNALTPPLMDALALAVEDTDADEQTRCIVITGGPDVFASGAGLGAVRDPALLDPGTAFWTAMASCETPMIAAVSGFALGAGCELALMCDIIIASDSAEFGQPEVTLGLIPGGGATQRLARLVGKQHAMEIVLTGRRLKAEEARRMGMVNSVDGRANFLERAMEMATVIARRPPMATKLAKRAVLTSEETGLEAGLAAERRFYQLAMATEDRVEAMEAMVEKRTPQFKGR